MSGLLKLAERVEKATGPDRELDGLIYRSIDPVIEECWKFWSPAQLETIVPRYTGSLDAAVTLVPQGFQWKCGYSRHVPHQASLVDYQNHSGSYDGNSDHSRALALVAASLRARDGIPVGQTPESL